MAASGAVGPGPKAPRIQRSRPPPPPRFFAPPAPPLRALYSAPCAGRGDREGPERQPEATPAACRAMCEVNTSCRFFSAEELV